MKKTTIPIIQHGYGKIYQHVMFGKDNPVYGFFEWRVDGITKDLVDLAGCGQKRSAMRDAVQRRASRILKKMEVPSFIFGLYDGMYSAPVMKETIDEARCRIRDFSRKRTFLCIKEAIKPLLFVLL